jgi:hypothetical protein
MKKIILLSVLSFVFVFVSYQSKASSIYKVDDVAIETLFAGSQTILTGISTASSLLMPMTTDAVMAEKNVWIAVVLDFFLGGIAIHRVYLGGTPVLILGYLFTFGGIFGLVPLIDFVVLIVESGDISKYVGSNKFFMW